MIDEINPQDNRINGGITAGADSDASSQACANFQAEIFNDRGNGWTDHSVENHRSPDGRALNQKETESKAPEHALTAKQREDLKDNAKQAAELLRGGKIVDREMLGKLVKDCYEQLGRDPRALAVIEKAINEELKEKGLAVKLDYHGLVGGPIFKEFVDFHLRGKDGKPTDDASITIRDEYHSSFPIDPKCLIEPELVFPRIRPEEKR